MIAQTNGQPTQLAINETHIYWTTLWTPASDASVCAERRQGHARRSRWERDHHHRRSATAPPACSHERSRLLGEPRWGRRKRTIREQHGSVKGISLDGSSGQMTIASSQRRPVALATDGANNLYWSARGLNNGSQTSDGAIWTCNLANCVPRVLASPLVFPQQLLFRSPPSTGRARPSTAISRWAPIWQMPSAGGTASRVFVDAVKANRMAFSADTSTLYYSSSVLHTGRSAAHAAAPVPGHANTQNFDPQAILSAPPRIYWLTPATVLSSEASREQAKTICSPTEPPPVRSRPSPCRPPG